jgi:hypothetical protein
VKITLRQRAIDEKNARLSCIVVIAERATLDEANAHDLQIVSADESDVGRFGRR